MTSEREMLDLLLDRYTNIRIGSIADRWIRAEHVASGVGHRDGQRVIDFVAVDKYPGDRINSRLAFHGFEVKVSRSDWARELQDPSKSHAHRRYMHHWWLVVPDLSVVAKHELPEGWGLLVRSGDKLRAARTAPRLSPEPMPLDVTIALMSAVARTAYRDPLHRDSPVTYTPNGHRCAFCGQPSPCALHQPRFHATRTQLERSI